MPRKRVLEAAKPEDRATQRRKLGTLRELTVQPATRKRYDHATDLFLSFLQKEGHVLPREKHKMDPLVCDYVEHLWSSSTGRGLACDTLAGLQDLQPNLKNALPGAWRLLKTWHVNEVPNRAPPLPENVVQAMAGWSFFKGHYTFGVSLLVGFYTMLRTGELLGLRSSHLLSDPSRQQVLISLGLTKGGKRTGAAESVILGYEPIVRLVKFWKSVAHQSTPLALSPAKWRGLFNEGLCALKLETFGFRPYSLRRGGATFWFSKHQSLDRILISGRWQTQKSARIYINEGLALLTGMNLPSSAPNIRPFHKVYCQTIQSPQFSTLEPPTDGGRSGGRGRRKTLGMKKASKNLWEILFLLTYYWIFHSWMARRFGSAHLGGRVSWWLSSLGFGPAGEIGFPWDRVSNMFFRSICGSQLLLFSEKLAAKWNKGRCLSLCTSGPGG